MNSGGDVVFAFRQMRRFPGLAASSVISLALGIGSAAAVFSVLADVLRQLGVRKEVL